MAARSTTVKFQNETSQGLTLIHAELIHGGWVPNMYPPEKIKPFSEATWQSEEIGLATGVKGIVKYLIPKKGDVTIEWKNPYIGDNSYSTSGPGGFEVNKSGGSGNHATVIITLIECKVPQNKSFKELEVLTN